MFWELQQKQEIDEKVGKEEDPTLECFIFYFSWALTALTCYYSKFKLIKYRIKREREKQNKFGFQNKS